jgi:hypothetical protein
MTHEPPGSFCSTGNRQSRRARFSRDARAVRRAFAVGRRLYPDPALTIGAIDVAIAEVQASRSSPFSGRFLAVVRKVSARAARAEGTPLPEWMAARVGEPVLSRSLIHNVMLHAAFPIAWDIAHGN